MVSLGLGSYVYGSGLGVSAFEKFVPATETSSQTRTIQTDPPTIVTLKKLQKPRLHGDYCFDGFAFFVEGECLVNFL